MSEVKDNSYLGSYNFQGGETGYFSMNPYGEGDSIAEIKFLAPEGAEKITFGNGDLGWQLADGTELNLTKGLFTRRLGDNIEPDGDMTLDDDWSFLDAF